MLFSVFFLACAATATAAIRRIGGAGREEFVYGELDLTEELARIFFAAAADTDAFLSGQAVVVYGNEKLGVTFQADDGELSQGN